MGALNAPVSSFLLFFLYALISLSHGYFIKTANKCKPPHMVPKSFHDFKANALNGSTVDFKSFKNKVVLVVNVATF